MGFSQVANSGLITDLIGDKDCFGLGGSCADGDHYRDDLGGDYFTDNRSAGEVLGVDQWAGSSTLGGPSFTFGLDLAGATALSASLEIFTAGIDLGSGATLSFNSTSIGTYVEPSGLENMAKTLFFAIPIGLLSNPDSLSFSLSSGSDGFIIDYLELTVVTDSGAAVPAPATLALLGLGLAGLGWSRRKKA